MSILDTVKRERKVPKLSINNGQIQQSYPKSNFGNFFVSLTSRANRDLFPQLVPSQEKIEQALSQRGGEQVPSPSNTTTKGMTFYQHKKRGQSKFGIKGSEVQKIRNKLIDEIIQQYSQTARDQKESQVKTKITQNPASIQKLSQPIVQSLQSQNKESNSDNYLQRANKSVTKSLAIPNEKQSYTIQISKIEEPVEEGRQNWLMSKQTSETKNLSVKNSDEGSSKSPRSFDQSSNENSQSLKIKQKGKQNKKTKQQFLTMESEKLKTQTYENEDYQMSFKIKSRYDEFAVNNNERKNSEGRKMTASIDFNQNKEFLGDNLKVSKHVNFFMPETLNALTGNLRQSKSNQMIQQNQININEQAQSSGANNKYNQKVFQDKKKLNEIKEKIVNANLEETKQLLQEIDEQEKQLILQEKKRHSKTKSNHNQNIALTIDKNFQKKRGTIHSQKNQAARLIIKSERNGVEQETGENQNLFEDMYEENQERIQNLLKKTNPF